MIGTLICKYYITFLTVLYPLITHINTIKHLLSAIIQQNLALLKKIALSVTRQKLNVQNIFTNA